METIRYNTRKYLKIEGEKNMRKLKNFCIAGMIFLLLFLFPIHCQAAGALTDLGDLEKYGQVGQDSYGKFSDKVGVFITVFQYVGSIASVICIIVIGIRYMVGSVEEKAQYKKTLMPYLIGAVLVFATTNILSIVYNVTIKVV